MKVPRIFYFPPYRDAHWKESTDRRRRRARRGDGRVEAEVPRTCGTMSRRTSGFLRDRIGIQTSSSRQRERRSSRGNHASRSAAAALPIALLKARHAADEQVRRSRRASRPNASSGPSSPPAAGGCRNRWPSSRRKCAPVIHGRRDDGSRFGDSPLGARRPRLVVFA